MKEKIREVLKSFGFDSEAKAYGNGHINDTYILEDSNYILQKINTSIFQNPDELMENIENVTEFLKEKIGQAGGNPERETLSVVKTVDQKPYCKAADGSVYRMYKFIDHTRTVESNATEDDLYYAGIGFGKFQKMLSDFPVEKLHETIPNFHHTPKRVEAFEAAVKEDRAGRAAGVQKEIEFALSFAKEADVVLKGMEEGSILTRVTHNDTKINNILFEADSNEAVCVIDLDTVMPGSLLYDVGDALRVGGATAAEDETDLEKVHFNEKAFEAFIKGYLKEMNGVLTEREMELLPFGVRLMTYECGIRFLGDYLNGDVYFKIHREHHNLDRARTQFKLVAELAEKEELMKAAVARCLSC